jgi:hypothetical protein
MNSTGFSRNNRVKWILGGLGILAVLAILYPMLSGPHAAALSGEDHQAHTDHTGSGSPREAGQSAFAAIAEIVALLNADPDTDWSKVDIDALRAHLVDMNSLTLGATASQQTNGDTVTFRITGEGDVLRAIHAMVPAHARELDKIGTWRVRAQTTPEGAVLQVSTDSSNEIGRIEALGFFGLMATGSHHQPHHMAMAKGEMMRH